MWTKFTRFTYLWVKIRSIFDIFDQISIKFEDTFESGPRSRIGFVATSNRTAVFESQKSIKSRFEYDIDQILADLDLIALAYSQPDLFAQEALLGSFNKVIISVS